MGFDATPLLGNMRSKRYAFLWNDYVDVMLYFSRYAMTIEDGVVKTLAVEPDGTGLTVSLACNLVKKD